MAQDRKYGQVEVPGIPDDEPIFILRAQDKSTPQVINQYADTSLTNGSPSEHAAAARRIATDMRDWQASHPDRVKAAD